MANDQLQQTPLFDWQNTLKYQNHSGWVCNQTMMLKKYIAIWEKN